MMRKPKLARALLASVILCSVLLGVCSAAFWQLSAEMLTKTVRAAAAPDSRAITSGSIAEGSQRTVDRRSSTTPAFATSATTSQINSPAACTSPGTSSDRPNGRPPLHPNGTLVKVANNGTVYLIDGGRKRAISSQQVLNALYTNGGFTLNEVITIDADELALYVNGADITSTLPSNGRSRPDGKLIQASGGSEVSIVTNNGGRRPFASGTRFSTLGYQFCNVNVVTATEYNSYQPAGMAAGELATLTAPTNGATGQSLTPTLTWSSVAGANLYAVQVATSPSALPSSPFFTECFSCVINTTTSNTSFTPTSTLSANTTYYWQIQASNFPDASVWSATWSFTTMSTPPVIRISPTTLNFAATAQGAAVGQQSTENSDSTSVTVSETSAPPIVGRDGGHNAPSHQPGTKQTAGIATQSCVVNFAGLSVQEALLPFRAESIGVHPPVTNLEGEGEKEFRPPAGTTHNLKGKHAPAKAKAGAEGPPQFIPSGPSPSTSTSFQALGDNGGLFPPDTNGTVGPNHVMTTLNSQYRIQDRSGAVLATVSPQTFWAGVSVDFPFDPRSVYDPYSNRWIVAACSDPHVAAASVLIAVSQSSDPTGNWNVYRVDVDAGDSSWADYPSLGFNKNWAAVRVNLISNSNGSDTGVSLYVFNKADLYNGGAGLFTRLQDSLLHNAEVATTYDSTLSALYLVQDWQGNFNGTGTLRISSVTGSVGSEVLNSGIAFPATNNTWNTTPPGGPFANFAPQLDSTQKIFTLDSRARSVVYRNGSLWCTQTIFLPSSGSATRSSIQWWQVTPGGSVQQFGRIDDATGNTFYAFPSIAVNKNNDALVGYSRFSSSQYASADYSFRSAGDTLNTLRSDAVLKAGEGPYYRVADDNVNRWGDYSGTVVDPVNDVDMWTLQEYAAPPVNGQGRWGTWWGRVKPPLPTQFQLFTVFNDGGSTLTVTGITKQNNAPWVSIDSSTQAPFNVAPGGSGNVAVLVDPNGLLPGSYSERLLVASNDSARNPYPNGVYVNLSIAPATVTVTITTSPVGRSYTVDGVSYSATQNFVWDSGSSHNIAATSPQGGAAGTQYVWSGWSDGGVLAHTISPTADATYTATFLTQYYLTMSAGSGGTVSPPSGWYDSGQTVSISAVPAAGYNFLNWSGSGSGSYTGANNPASVTLLGPVTETANFVGVNTANPGDVLISEFRLRGPAGANDEFIEFYNNTNADITVGTADGSSGWALSALEAGSPTATTKFVIPNGTVIPARRHLLAINSNAASGPYSLGTYAGGDLSYTSDIADGAGIALFRTANPNNLTPDNRLDAVGFTNVPDAQWREGSGLTPAGGVTANAQFSFVRTMASGLPQDTNDNARDFALVSVDGGTYGGIQSLLGAPAPENLASPVQRNATIKASLVDAGAASTAAPNRVRDFTSYVDTLTPSAPNGGTPASNPYANGTLVIRRKFKNSTGAFVTRLRFRVIDITTAPPPAGTADLRLLSSSDVTVSLTGGGTALVRGLTLDQPPTQARGGGLNSSATAGVITMAAPLANGASVNVEFRLGIVQGGSFRFIVNVEASP